MRYRNKKDWILSFVKDKKVLDLGCVEHHLERTTNENWLHRLIKNEAASVLGVDFLCEEVEKLNEQGYNCVCADVEKLELNDQFEVVVAGDIIEHLSNCGLFLEKVYKHLKDDGIFLVTTPNPVHYLRFVRLQFHRTAGANPEHTCWFTDKVLGQLAKRYQLEIVNQAYVDDAYQYYSFSWLWRPFVILNYFLCLLFPQFSETLCFVLKKKEK